MSFFVMGILHYHDENIWKGTVCWPLINKELYL